MLFNNTWKATLGQTADVMGLIPEGQSYSKLQESTYTFVRLDPTLRVD